LEVETYGPANFFFWGWRCLILSSRGILVGRAKPLNRSSTNKTSLPDQIRDVPCRPTRGLGRKTTIPKFSLFKLFAQLTGTDYPHKAAMADDDSKEDLAALSALDAEAKEFDKVCAPCRQVPMPTDHSSQDAEIDRILRAFRLDA
jgi:hypothetical protein